jgi:hypothetical protein
MKSARFLALSFAASVSSALLMGQAHAQIYKYVDPVTGAVEYTNQPKKGASRMDSADTLSEIPTGNKPAKSKTGAGANTVPRAVNASTNSSAGTSSAVVDASTQKTRDGTRRQVLSDELSNEEKALSETRLAFNSGKPLPMADEGIGSPKYIDRTKQLEQTLRHHERNVAALKQELSNLKL